jgi:hypothetical protein
MDRNNFFPLNPLLRFVNKHYREIPFPVSHYPYRYAYYKVDFIKYSMKNNF